MMEQMPKAKAFCFFCPQERFYHHDLPCSFPALLIINVGWQKLENEPNKSLTFHTDVITM